MNFDEITAELEKLEAKDFDFNNAEMDGPERLDNLVRDLLATNEPELATIQMFRLMERLNDSELGSPGPLVHALESLDYRDALSESVQRCPTELSLWMLNRILNTDLSSTERVKYVDLLRRSSVHEKSTERVKEVARDFLQFQVAKNA
ncbi:MAG: hypothetical protein ABJ000_03890 [Saccharospirillum sp.]|uniref:hypothetical protein n=1 Tax=Saccharospirillum sp. TaxID=2033801 RepID=UPI003298ACB5